MSNISKLGSLIVIVALSASPSLAQGRCESPSGNAVSGGFADRATAAARSWASGQPMARAPSARSRQTVADRSTPPRTNPTATAGQQGPTAAEVFDIFSTVLTVGAAVAAARNDSRTQQSIGPAGAVSKCSRSDGSCGIDYVGGPRR